MIVLGIDPGLQRCGYALLESGGGDERLVEAGVIRTDGKKDLGERLEQIAVDLESLLGRFSVDVLAIEKLYSNYKHPTTAILMGHARGVVMQVCTHVGADVREYEATRIKKSLTGNGRAKKGQIQRAVAAVLGLAEVPEPDDVADAMAAALCCANEMELIRNDV
jgi:crossover junction endodeoxyribonuclease RuvC